MLSSKNQQHPCAECSFRKDTKPCNLGGSSPEVYIGQAEGPFMVPCHMLCDFTDPQWRGRSWETGQCAGMAVYRANLGITGLPEKLHSLPPSPEVFESHEQFLAHHACISEDQAKFVLSFCPPELMLEKELRRSTIMVKAV